MADLNRCVTDSEICIYRGDTSPLIYDLVDAAGNPFDGTGRTYVLTVSDESEPADATPQRFDIVGVVATTRVTFTPLLADVAAVFFAFFDIQETSGAAILTIGKGTFQTFQDITK